MQLLVHQTSLYTAYGDAANMPYGDAYAALG